MQAEQGERQEAVVVPAKRTGATGFAKGIEDGWNAAIDAVLRLNSTPQPGPDVRGLVEALELWLADYDKVAANPDFEPFPHIAEFVDKSRAALATYHQDT